jgi:phosphotransferase system  glucose/maltose/N-acetylglucosamine-specific IIC component
MRYKVWLTIALFTNALAGFSQSATSPPIEVRHTVSYWWWILGVVIALLLGVGGYMLIKKDPRRDAVD